MGKSIRRRRQAKRGGSRFSQEELSKRRAARRHKTDIRTTFLNAGFEHIPTRDKEIRVAERRGEIDAVYAHENIVVCLEDTQLSGQGEIVEHLRKKVEFWRHLRNHKTELLHVLRRRFPAFRGYMQRHPTYETAEYRVVYVYTSLNDLDATHKHRYADECRFLDHSFLKYFLSISRTIHRSARFEILKFLGLELKDVGTQRSASDVTEYEALLLPEAASSFPEGHKLVSFLVDPEMLLERAYVLRSDSWRDSDCLYQRLLMKSKINSMREYLAAEGRVFVNNIIATLPEQCQICDRQGNLITPSEVDKITPVLISCTVYFH